MSIFRTLFLLAALSTPLSARAGEDLRIEGRADDLTVYRGAAPLTPYEFAVLTDDTANLPEMRALRKTRNIGHAGLPMIIHGAIGLVATASVADILGAEGILLVGTPMAITLATGGVFYSRGMVAKRRLSSYSVWYTPQQVQDQISGYSAQPAAAAATIDAQPMGMLQLVENDRGLQLYDSNERHLDAGAFAGLIGDTTRQAQIKKTRRRVTAGSIVVLSVSGAMLQTVLPTLSEPTPAGLTLIGLGAGGVAAGTTGLVLGRRRVKSLETWYTPDEIRTGVEAHNRAQVQHRRLPPEPPAVALQLGVVSGGVGLAATF